MREDEHQTGEDRERGIKNRIGKGLVAGFYLGFFFSSFSAFFSCVGFATWMGKVKEI